MIQLQPRDIVDCYTLAEIETEITAIKLAITTARQSARDKFGDSQASQDVWRQSLNDLRAELAVWIKAKNLASGEDSGSAEFLPFDYNPSIPRI